MTPLPLGNLIAWSVQVALIVGVGLAALWLVRLEAPAVRYVLLRALLVICLALPFVQPRIALQHPAVSPVAPAAIAAEIIVRA